MCISCLDWWRFWSWGAGPQAGLGPSMPGLGPALPLLGLHTWIRSCAVLAGTPVPRSGPTSRAQELGAGIAPAWPQTLVSGPMPPCVPDLVCGATLYGPWGLSQVCKCGSRGVEPNNMVLGVGSGLQARD